MCEVEPDDGGGQREGAPVHLPNFNQGDGRQKGEAALDALRVHVHHGLVWDGAFLVERPQQFHQKSGEILISCINCGKKSS